MNLIKRPQQILSKVKGYIHKLEDYRPVKRFDLDPEKIKSKTLQLAIPEYTSPVQWRYLNLAIRYAREHGVALIVTRIRGMKPVELLPFRQWAEIHRTEKFISVEPLSGYRMVVREDEGYIIYLPPDANDDALGAVLLKVLDRSRFVWPDDDRDLLKAERYTQCYRNWEKDFMSRYGYTTKRDAYKKMNWCRAKRSEGTISIRPHQRRDKPGEWRWLPPEQDVAIPATRHAAAVGAALRLAFDRCE